MSNRPSRQAARKRDGQMTKIEAPSSGADSRLWWWVGGGLAVVVAIFLIVAIASGDDDDAPSGRDIRQVAFVEVVGSPLPTFSASSVDTTIGSPAPGIVATEFDDTEHTITPGDGTARVIGFFAHWCPHCQAELPRLVDWLGENEVPAGVEIVGISTSVDEGQPNWPPSAWFEDENWDQLTLRDSPTSDISAAYGLAGFPYFVVVGADGNVVTRVSGELSTEAWESLVNQAAASVG